MVIYQELSASFSHFLFSLKCHPKANYWH